MASRIRNRTLALGILLFIVYLCVVPSAHKVPSSSSGTPSIDPFWLDVLLLGALLLFGISLLITLGQVVRRIVRSIRRHPTRTLFVVLWLLLYGGLSTLPLQVSLLQQGALSGSGALFCVLLYRLLVAVATGPRRRDATLFSTRAAMQQRSTTAQHRMTTLSSEYLDEITTLLKRR